MSKVVKYNEVAEIRDMLLVEQSGKCPLCGRTISSTEACLDHQHKKRKADIPENGFGFIRGVLCRDCNALEGRIWNAMSRHVQPATVQERLDWLRSLIGYYESGTTDMIYPGEMPRQKVSKRKFNQLSKLWHADHPKAKPLQYPKSGYITKRLAALFKSYDIDPYNN